MPTSTDVDAWFARYDNPMKDVVQRMREIILAADPRIEECIKWQAPTFTFKRRLHQYWQGLARPGRRRRGGTLMA